MMVLCMNIRYFFHLNSFLQHLALLRLLSFAKKIIKKKKIIRIGKKNYSEFFCNFYQHILCDSPNFEIKPQHQMIPSVWMTGVALIE